MAEKNVYLGFVVDVASFYVTGKIKCLLPDEHLIKFLSENKNYYYLDKIDVKSKTNFFKSLQEYIANSCLVDVIVPTSYGGYDTGIYVVPNLYSFCYITPLYKNFEKNIAILLGFTFEGYTTYENSTDKDIKDFPLPFKFPSPFAVREQEVIKDGDNKIFYDKNEDKKPTSGINVNNSKDKTFAPNSIVIKQKYNNLFTRDGEKIPTENLIIINENNIAIYKRKIKDTLKTEKEGKDIFFSDIGDFSNEDKKDANNFKYPDLTKQFYNSFIIDDKGVTATVYTSKKDDDTTNIIDVSKETEIEKIKDYNKLSKTTLEWKDSKIKINIENPNSFEEVDKEKEFSEEEKKARNEFEINEKEFKFLIKSNNENDKVNVQGRFSLNYEIDDNTGEIKTDTIKSPLYELKTNFKEVLSEISFNSGDDEDGLGQIKILNKDNRDDNKIIENKLILDLKNFNNTLTTQNDKDIVLVEQSLKDDNNKYLLLSTKNDNDEVSIKLDLKNKELKFYTKDGKLSIDNGESTITIEKGKDIELKTDKKFVVDAKEINIKDGGDTVPLLSKLEQLFNDNLVNHTHTCSHGTTSTSSQCAKLSSLQNIKSKKIKTD